MAQPLCRRLRDTLHEVRQATDWLDGYRRIHARYGRRYDHCQIYQETGILINTIRLASSGGEGIYMQ